MLHKYDNVFNLHLSDCNGVVGPLEPTSIWVQCNLPKVKAEFLSIQRTSLSIPKKCSINYNGVFKLPEDVGITVEHINPSFLVKKPSGEFRLVTAFANVGRYSKPKPFLMPHVDSTLRQAAR